MLEPAFHLPERLCIVCREDAADRLIAALGNHEVDLVLSDSPLSPGSGTKAFNHLLGKSGTTIFASRQLASKLRRRFPKSIHGAPFIMPGEHSVLRREIAAWLDTRDIRPEVVAEVDDSALAKVFGQAGIALFAGPTVIERAITGQYSVEVVGRIPELEERYYAISLERRIRHAGVLAISSAARELFSG